MKIKVMQCLWNRTLEGEIVDVEKITSKQPSIRVLLLEIITRLDKLDQRIDNLVQKNNLKE